MEIRGIAEDVLGGAIWWAIVLLSPIIWAGLRNLWPKVASTILYATVGTAATLVIYVLVRVALLEPAPDEPIVVKFADPAPIQELVSDWLADSSATAVMPLDTPPKGELFRTNFIYGTHTINLFVAEKRPEFLIARIPDPISDDERSWWAGLTVPERNDVLYELQLVVGLETGIGVSVMEGQVGASRSRTMFLQIDKHIPIDTGLSRSWFWRDIEAAARYMRVYKTAFTKYYGEHSNGNR